MRRPAALLLICSFLVLGTGLAEYVHNAAHAGPEASAALSGHAIGGGEGHDGRDAPDGPAPFHTDSNCRIHAMLHAPLLAGGWVPVLACLGVFVAFLSLLAPPPVSRRAPLRIDCRGPPAC